MRTSPPRTSRQLRQTIALLRGITSKSELLEAGLPAIRSLIGADIASTVAIGPGRAIGRPAFEPADAMHRADLAAYAVFRDQQPLIGDFRRHGAPAPVRTTDVVSVTDFARLDLYQHFYRPLGITYQLAIGVPEENGWTAGYTLSRSAADFDAASVELMTLLQVSLAGAHHGIAVESMRRQFGNLAQLLRGPGPDRQFCLVTIDPGGRVELAAGPLLGRVEAQFGRLSAGSAAPARLARILAASRVSFRQQVGLGGQDSADVVSWPDREAGGSLLFELRDRGDLRSRFGLTPGEYRTLANIVRYETNERVAQAEGVSVPTIEKRMSSVLRKMRVETRVGAVREFLRSAGHGPGD